MLLLMVYKAWQQINEESIVGRYMPLVQGSSPKEKAIITPLSSFGAAALLLLCCSWLLASETHCVENSEGQVGSALDLTDFQLVFDEEFDRLDVSARGPNTRWISHTPWNGDFGDAQFIDPRPKFPFTVNNGILTIEARKGSRGK